MLVTCFGFVRWQSIGEKHLVMAKRGCVVPQICPARMEIETGSPVSGDLQMVVVATCTEQNLFEVGINAISGSGNGVSGAGSGGPSSAGVKRKRGRPRKQDASVNTVVPMLLAPSDSPLEALPKRGRGRPKGSGKLRLLSSIGEVSSSAQKNFYTYAETVQIGEDIVGKILSYSQKGRRAVCVLSANGVVSSTIIHQPAGSSADFLKYEGCFEILSLSGSYLIKDSASARRDISKMTVLLAKPDGQVFGGAISGSLIAGGPVQLVVATFKQTTKKGASRKRSIDSSTVAGRGSSDMAGIPGPAAAAVETDAPIDTLAVYDSPF